MIRPPAGNVSREGQVRLVIVPGKGPKIDSDAGAASALDPQGCFIVGAGLAVCLESPLAHGEVVGPTLPGGKLLDPLRCFPARHGLGVARARALDHPPKPPGLGTDAALFGQL